MSEQVQVSTYCILKRPKHQTLPVPRRLAHPREPPRPDDAACAARRDERPYLREAESVVDGIVGDLAGAGGGHLGKRYGVRRVQEKVRQTQKKGRLLQ